MPTTLRLLLLRLHDERAASLVEYAVEEKQLLVKRAALEDFTGALARLRDGIERLEKRVERLAGGR